MMRSTNSRTWAIRLAHVVGIQIFLASAFVFAAQGQDTSASSGYKVMRGRQTFRLFCSSCHGAKADGTGEIAQYLSDQPADLTKILDRHDGQFPRELLHSYIDGREKGAGHSGRDMPKWGDVFQSELSGEAERGELPEERASRKIDELLSFLETIQQPGE